MIATEAPRFSTRVEFDVSDVRRRFYCGFYKDHAIACFDAGYEDNASSWMWRDAAETDEGFRPVAGTLRVTQKHGILGIEYVDLRDAIKNIENTGGDGI